MDGSTLKIASGSKLLFIGDSITDAGRAQPVGEGLFGAHGTGYVNIVAGLLSAIYGDHQIRVVNQGSSGNTVLDLKARWQRDVLDQAPDWLSVMIGINDVWRQFDLPLQTEQHVGIELYERTLDELISRTKPSLKGLVMMTPFYIEPLQADAMRSRMDRYGEAVQRLSTKHGAIFVDTQAAFDRVMKDWYPAAMAWDRVHPNQTGTTVIAKAFLDAVGFDWRRN
ncbi:MAG: SGNH/GDSL hydrolase family protein [Fimbriimonas sp.]|nr:SGNH/GDSL hydrolase family protein [Fimbriimonas sp.]